MQKRTSRRFFGYRRTSHGWDLKCNLLARFTDRAYNPLTIAWFSADRKLVVNLPQCPSHHIDFVCLASWLVPRIITAGSIALVLMFCAALETL